MEARSIDPKPRDDAERAARADENAWRTIGTLVRNHRLIVWTTFAAAVLSVVVSLLLPNWYRASSRLLLPDSSGAGLAGALLGDLGSAAESLLGAGGGDYVRYLAILSSRSVFERVVERFDLVEVYGVEDSDTPTDDAIDELMDHVELVVDDEFDFLSIEVLDRDPQRAADMANYFVEALDEISNQLSSQTAGNFRRYVEERYTESQQTRAALLDSLRAFQQRYGVFNLEIQTTAFFDQLAQMRGEALQAEIRYEALRNQLGDANSQVLSLREVVEVTDRKFQEALQGRERVLPVAQSEVPSLVRTFLDLEMERTIQERILELVAPMLEQARFEEQRKVQSVQVVDAATPPARKDQPKRSIIVMASTLSAFILIILYVLLSSWWNRRSAWFASRIREAAARA